MEITTLNNDVWKDVMQLMQETVLTYKKFKKRFYSSDVKYMFLYIGQVACRTEGLNILPDFTHSDK